MGFFFAKAAGAISEIEGGGPVTIHPDEWAQLPAGERGGEAKCDKTGAILGAVMGGTGVIAGALLAPDKTTQYILMAGLGASGYFIGQAAGKPLQNARELRYAGYAVAGLGGALTVYMLGYGESNPYLAYPAGAAASAIVLGPIVSKQLQVSTDVIGIIAKPFTGLISVFVDAEQCFEEIGDAIKYEGMDKCQNVGWTKHSLAAAMSDDPAVQSCIVAKIEANPNIYGAPTQKHPYLGEVEENSAVPGGYLYTSKWRCDTVERLKQNAEIMGPLESCWGSQLPVTNSPKPCYSTTEHGEWWYRLQGDKLCRVDGARAEELCGNTTTIITKNQMDAQMARQGGVSVCQ